jgi:hypothetical protein
MTHVVDFNYYQKTFGYKSNWSNLNIMGKSYLPFESIGFMASLLPVYGYKDEIYLLLNVLCKASRNALLKD